MECSEKKISIELDGNIYSRDAIMKCLYWYSTDYKIDITQEGTVYIINIEPYHKVSDEHLNQMAKKLRTEFLDYNLRDIVKKETTTIRELIIAKAFSNGEFDEEPKGDLMDPLGIKFLEN